MKISWVARLYIYGTFTILIGPFYDNWVSMEKYLYRVGAYSNLCSDVDPNAPVKDTWICQAQQESVTMLLTVARSSECAFSVLIGIFMDRVGPKITAIIGSVLRIIGWTLIGFTVHINYSIVVAFFLMGLSVNFLVFPALTVGLYTKKYRFVAIVQVGMCSCFASLIIKIKVAILEAGLLTPEQINYLYTIICLLPCLVLSAIYFPLKLQGNIYCDDDDDDDDDHEPNANEVTTSTCPTETTISVIPIPVRVLPLHMEKETTLENKNESIKNAQENNSIAISDEKCPEICDESKMQWYRGLWRTLTTKEVITCLVYFAYNFGSITFVQQSYSLMYRDNSFLLTFIEYLIPLAFLPCIAFSALYLYVKPLWILIGLNVLGAIMHLVATVRSEATGVSLALILVVVYCILNTKVYNYLDSLFDETYMGSIVGALNSICGVWLLLQGLIVQGKSSPQDLDMINYVMLAVRIVFNIPFLYLWYARIPPKLSLEGEQEETAEMQPLSESVASAASMV